MDHFTYSNGVLHAEDVDLRAIAADNPGNVLVVLDVCSATRVLSEFLLDAGARAEEAAVMIEAALAPLRELARQQRDQDVLGVPLDHLELLLGRARLQQQEPESALRLIDTANARLAERAARRRDDFTNLRYHAEAQRYLAELYLESDPTRATTCLRTALEIAHGLAEEGRAGPSLTAFETEVEGLLNASQRAR